MSVLDNYQCEGQISIYDLLSPDGSYGKTYPAPSRRERRKVAISDVCLKKFAELRIKPPQYLCLKRENGQIAEQSWETGGALLGEFTIVSFGESPSVAVASRLSQILQENPHPKYCLSARACQGILNRANKRGKNLPEQLETALKRQAMSLATKSCLVSSQESKPQSETPKTDSTSLVSKNAQDVQGGGKGILIQNEKTASLRTVTNQSVMCYGMDNERRRGPDEFTEQTPTVTSRAGTGGNNVPVVIDKKEPILLESNQNHATVQTNGVSTCLPASMGEGGGYVPMVCEPTSWDGSQTSPTLNANNANGAQRMPDKDNFNAVITYGLDRASFNQGKNAQYDFSVEEELAQTIVSRGPGGGTYETIGALCARDYKGVGSQYVNEGKVIVQDV